jgi:hypothetical protein
MRMEIGGYVRDKEGKGSGKDGGKRDKNQRRKIELD